MNNNLPSVLIFSEEYVKLTKGMSLVWRNHANETSQHFIVNILLNKEHWVAPELANDFGSNPNVRIHRLPFNMPSTTLSRKIFRSNNAAILNFTWTKFCRLMNLCFSPFIVTYLAVWLHRQNLRAIYSHTGGWPAGDLGRWIMISAFLARIPNRIFIIHSHPVIIYNRFKKFLFIPFRYMQKLIVNVCSTSIVTVSDSAKFALDAIFDRPVVRIHNGIPLLQKPSSGVDLENTPLSWQPVGKCIGFVGAIYPYKGPQVLIDAFSLVDLACELAFMGPAEPVLLKELQHKAQFLNNKVTFLGFHSNVDAFMQKIDVLVIPSIAYESFGMVILEAMKHKKPVICSDYGGMKEIVEEGVTGLIVPAGDNVALANAMSNLLSDEPLMRQMGENGYRRLNCLFTSSRMVAQYEDLLKGNDI